MGTLLIWVIILFLLIDELINKIKKVLSNIYLPNFKPYDSNSLILLSNSETFHFENELAPL